MLDEFFLFFFGLFSLFLGLYLQLYNFEMAHTFFDFVLNQFCETGVHWELVLHLIGYALSCILINVEVELGSRCLQLHVWSHDRARVLYRNVYCMRWASMPEGLHYVTGRSFLRWGKLVWLLGLSIRKLCRFGRLNVLSSWLDFKLWLPVVKLCPWGLQIWVWTGFFFFLVYSALFMRLFFYLIALILWWKVFTMSLFF